MDIRFRDAVPDDLARIQALAAQTIDVAYRAFIDEDAVDWFISGPSDAYLRDNLGNVTLAEANGAVAALAVCKGDLIDLLLVDHPLQGRGIGAALLAHCESKLFRQYDVINLESFENNGKANALYRRNGWVRVGTVPDAMSGARKWILEKRRDESRP